MHERKALMAKLSDAFIALPGGYGTFDELCEMATWDQLGIHAKPVVVVNVEGYFDAFLAQLDRAVADRSAEAGTSRTVGVCNDGGRCADRVGGVAAAAGAAVAARRGTAAVSAAYDAPAGRHAASRSPRHSLCFDRHRRNAVDARTAHRGRLRGARAIARARASSSSRSPGRPAGWCDHIARMWPVDAVVGENGAFYMHSRRAAAQARQALLVGDAERAANRARLAAIGEKILRAVPGAALASDQLYRETRPRHRFLRRRAAAAARRASIASSR